MTRFYYDRPSDAEVRRQANLRKVDDLLAKADVAADARQWELAQGFRDLAERERLAGLSTHERGKLRKPLLQTLLKADGASARAQAQADLDRFDSTEDLPEDDLTVAAREQVAARHMDRASYHGLTSDLGRGYRELATQTLAGRRDDEPDVVAARAAALAAARAKR